MQAVEERVSDLRAFLEQLPTGDVPSDLYAELERLVAKCWDDFHIAYDGGMEPWKLLRRMEGAHWQPPVLSFIVERHGATVLGSKRATMQRWSLDTEEMKAECDESRRRQLYANQPPLKVQPIAHEIVDCILGHKEHPNINWRKDGSVRVVSIGLLGSGPKQTMEGRRKRFREALSLLLEPHGWKAGGRGIYQLGHQGLA